MRTGVINCIIVLVYLQFVSRVCVCNFFQYIRCSVGSMRLLMLSYGVFFADGFWVFAYCKVR